MKKRVFWLLAAVLSVAMFVALVGCDGGEKSENQLTFTYADFNYNETPSEPVVTLQPLGGTIEYTYKGRGETEYAETTTVPVNAGTYTITGTVAETEDYKAVSYSVDFQINKVAPTGIVFPTASGSIEYGKKLSDVQLSTGTGEGTFAWADAETVPTVSNEGYEMIFTPSNGNYTALTQVVDVTVTPKKVTEITFPTVETFVYSPTTTLADVVLQGGSVTGAEGSFVWEIPSTVPTVKDAAATGYKMRFVPEDNLNYDYSEAADYNPDTKRVEQMVKFTVSKAAAPAQITFPQKVQLSYGSALKDAAVPTQEGGYFAWEAPETIPSSGDSAVLVFYADMDNYDYSGYTGTEKPDNEGRIEKTIAIEILKVEDAPDEAFIEELFLTVDASAAEVVRGGVTLGDLVLPAGYHIADDDLNTVIYSGFADEVSVYYNRDPENYLDSPEQDVMIYVETADAVQSTGAEGANIITEGIASKNNMITQQHVMVAPQKTEFLSRFAENDTVRITGSGITQTTVVNFIWKPGTFKNSTLGNPDYYANVNVRFYIKNNVTGETNFSFKAANGGVNLDKFQYGMHVVDLPAGDAGNSFYWGINGSPSFSMDGSGSFVGVDENGYFVFAIPFVLWEAAPEYDFEITLVIEPAVQPVTVEGDVLTLTQSDILTPTTVRMDNGQTLNMYALSRAESWNQFLVSLPVNKKLSDLGDNVMTIRGYMYTHQCNEDGSQGIYFGKDTLTFPHVGNLSKVSVSKTAQEWLEYLTSDTVENLRNCRLVYDGQTLCKDGTGYYIMKDGARVDVTAEQAMESTFDIYIAIAGAPMDASVLFTLEIAPPATPEA